MSAEVQGHTPIAREPVSAAQTHPTTGSDNTNVSSAGALPNTPSTKVNIAVPLPTTPSAQARPNVSSSNPSKRKDSHRHRFFHHFRPASQILLTWLLGGLSCVFFGLTVYYAFGTSFLLHSALVAHSPGNTILVIRVLSAVTELLMVGLVAGCFERTKWMLVASKNGAPILDFLTLSEGSGAAGFLAIALSRLKSINNARVWTLIRYG